MLAKQGWRILTSPNSFMSLMLQGIYFPRIPLLEVETTPIASFTWHSILSGLKLLRRGLEWRIGSGNQVRMWDNVWLPGTDHGHPTYHFSGMDSFRYVSDFIITDLRVWNEDLIRQCVAEEDVIHILNMRLSSRRSEDIIRWRHTIDGEYSVRSGYHVDFNSWWAESSLATIPNIDSALLPKCWNMKCPPRMKTLIWQAMDNNLPVRANLVRRGVEVEDVCPLCGMETETVIHLFFVCQVAQRMWQDMGAAVLPLAPGQAIEFFSSLFSVQDAVECSKRTTAMWSLWKIGNLRVFHPTKEVVFASEMEKEFCFLRDYLEASDHPIGTSPVRRTNWHPPEAGWVKVNVDTGICENGGGQIGVVVRGVHGQFIAVVTRLFQHLHHPTLLEGQAILTGLEFVWSLDLDGVVVESDCQVVVNHLSNGVSKRSDLAMILDDCRALSFNFGQIRFIYANREANSVVHALAKMPIPPDTDLLVFTWPPECLHELLERDAFAIFEE